MFEAVRNNKRFAQIVLAILIVPFAFFGMDAYFADGPAGNEVAVVGDTKIYAVEFEEALRNQQDRLRESMGGQVDRSLLDSPELRRAVLENLVNQRVLALHAAENRLVVTQAQLQAAIAEVPAFQDAGSFSMERYEAVLRGQGMSPAGFEARLSQDIRVQQLALAVGDASFTALESTRRFLAAQLEEREVREMRFAAADFLPRVELAADAVQRYYDANPTRYEQPAQVKAEYVVFDETALLGQIEVAEEELRQAYEGNPQRFGVGEERRARHILLELPADAPDERVQAASAEARSLFERLQADPSAFPALAREHSADPGSAGRGGDLGFFGRGVMVKPFEDAVFGAMKQQIIEPVRSEFGIHIIQLTDIKPATMRPFAEVRDELADELKRQRAGQRHAELAELFANTVYEQADSLAPAAELLKLEVRTSDWIARNAPGIGPYASERLVEALFSEEALDKRRNVDAVEVGAGTMVAARVVEHRPAQRLPFDQVKDAIEAELRAEEAARMASAAGEAAVAALQKGETADGSWGEALTVQRGSPVLAPQAVQAVFGANTASLPAHVGVALPGNGYAVYRIDSVNRPELGADDPRVTMMAGQYAQLMAERDFSAYLTLLRERYKVEVREAAIRPQQ